MVDRRRFLAFGAGGAVIAAAQQKPAEESVTASASVDTTPRVGIVLSDFRGSSDHDGAKVEGLRDPRPLDADLTSAQLDAMVRRAIELGNVRDGGLQTIIEPEDWVVVKPNIVTCQGLEPGGPRHPYIHGAVTDPRIVRTVIAWLVEHKRGLRFTIAEGSGEWLPAARSKAAVDGWSTRWGGAYDGVSYSQIVADLSRTYPKIKFELVDLNFEESIEMPVRGKPAARNNPSGSYTIPKTIQACDRLITIAPLKTHTLTGVSLSIKNYLGIGPGSKYGFPKEGLHKLGHPDEVMADLYCYHPADYAIVGGCWGVEGDGPHAPAASSVHHNVVIAGPNALAVDAVGATIMGIDPKALRFLRILEEKGLGIYDVDSIWTRGNDIDEARRPFRQSSGWKKA